ncbi:phosphotransferase enzyme family protein-like protein [Xylariaceae sp. FL0594]|nr:phosphotransferase enzyme family protein-like protein [Xylariaceae sp. FL0594]
MAPYDYIAQRDNDDERLNFLYRISDERDEIVSFVAERVGWAGAAEFDRYSRGSFNFNLHIRHTTTGERVLIRFPIPGRVRREWRDEKVANEVMTINYLRHHTSIPIPKVRCWGLTEESPQQLGPFIIMDFAEGKDLSDLLQQPTEDEQEEIVLDPNIDEAKLDIVYDQIAGFMLELARLEFPRLGAISKDAASGEWSAAKRPLTYDMNEVVTLGGVTANYFAATGPFDSSRDYFTFRAKTFEEHLEAQRNIAGDDEYLMWKHYVARRGFEALIPTYCDAADTEPFRLFCDDLRPTNMLADLETLRIIAVIDFEFTNAMPSQFVYDPPWWLLLKPPSSWISDDETQEFLDHFVPRMEQFLQAMERAEQRLESSSTEGGQRTSRNIAARMRDSWISGRFWFNYASRSSFDIEEIYWTMLPQNDLNEKESTGAVLDDFVQRKMLQFKKYKTQRENDERSSEDCHRFDQT